MVLVSKLEHFNLYNKMPSVQQTFYQLDSFKKYQQTVQLGHETLHTQIGKKDLLKPIKNKFTHGTSKRLILEGSKVLHISVLEEEDLVKPRKCLLARGISTGSLASIHRQGAQHIWSLDLMLPQPMFTRMCQQWLHVNVFPNTLCAKRSPCQGIPSFAAIVISGL